jgi:predicted nucleic acid-binding Zn ribbon protein
MLRYPMAKKLAKLSSTLGSLLRARGLQGRLSEYRIVGQWEETVGPVIARHARPQTVRGKKLYLSVDSPAWMQQLSLLKPEIIEKVNRNFGKDAINDITLRLGEVVPSEQRGEEALSRPPLDAEERGRIEQYVQQVQDPDVREAIRRVIEKDFQSKKGAATGKGTKK